jgi:hypothetical protein
MSDFDRILRFCIPPVLLLLRFEFFLPWLRSGSHVDQVGFIQVPVLLSSPYLLFAESVL